MGKQVLGGLVMFATIWVVPYAQFSAPDTQELETLRIVLLVAIRGFTFVILFCVFFVGLKVFAIGLEQERAERGGQYAATELSAVGAPGANVRFRGRPMTEAEWLVSDEPAEMLKYLPSEHLARKLRLFACACCRRICPLPDDAHADALGAAERYADRLLGVDALALRRIEHRPERYPYDATIAVRAAANELGARPVAAAFFAADAVANAEAVAGDRDAVRTAEQVAQAELLHDIFGNPFRPVTFSPEWQTITAVALANLMYDSRDFGAMPILADALQDAGCDSDDILDHCRGPGPHVRGYWVVDLVLGKE